MKNLVKERKRHIKANENLSEYENTVEDWMKIDMECEEREKISIIEKTVKGMKEIDIEIFKLYYYSANKVRDISKILGISEFNIKTRMYRIRKKIKKELEKGGYSNE